VDPIRLRLRAGRSQPQMMAAQEGERVLEVHDRSREIVPLPLAISGKLEQRVDEPIFWAIGDAVPDFCGFVPARCALVQQ